MMYKLILLAFMPMLVAALVVMVAHPTAVRIARLKSIVDNPNARRLNIVPVPVLGGVGVLLGVVLGIGVTSCFMPNGALPAELLIAMVVMLFVGVSDDILDLTPGIKLLWQIVAVGLMILSAELYINNVYGLWGLYYLPEWMSIGFTLLFGVGVINAINLIDGVDGLCALYVIFVSLLCGVGLLLAEDDVYAVVAFAVVGALIPFVLHNIYGRKSKMFLGDGGSLMLGLLCVVLIVRHIQISVCAMGANCIAFTFAVLAVPVCDTLRVMGERLKCGSSPFKADKKHLHHHLIALGMSHRSVAVSIVMLNMAVVSVWCIATLTGLNAEWVLLLTVMMGVLLTWGLCFGVLRTIERRTLLVRSKRGVDGNSSE